MSRNRIRISILLTQFAKRSLVFDELNSDVDYPILDALEVMQSALVLLQTNISHDALPLMAIQTFLFISFLTTM